MVGEVSRRRHVTDRWFRCKRHSRFRPVVCSGRKVVYIKTWTVAESGIGSNPGQGTGRNLDQGSPILRRDIRFRRGASRYGRIIGLATFHRVTGWGIRPAFPLGRKDRGPSAAGRCSVLPWETLRARDDRRARRRTDRTALEQLEGRQLLSYSSLGYSLPDLRVTGLAGPVAAWGSSYSVTINLQQTGASTMVEPLSLTPPGQVGIGPDGSPVPPYAVPSSADATSPQVNIYLTPRPHSLAGALQIGSVTLPSLGQNDVEQYTAPLVLPQHPVGYPSTGVYYIRLIANQKQSFAESNYANNISPAIPVRIISTALPMLRVTALDVPTVMQPGDTIAPTFQVTNLGTAATDVQGPVQVALVASVTPDFNLGSSIVALYTLPSGIPGQSSAPIANSARHHRRLFGPNGSVNNVTPQGNVETYTGAAVTLPTSPGAYYLGIVIDPNNTLNQISLPANRLEQVRVVGPAVPGLPAAGVVSTPLTGQFPNPPDGVSIGNVNPAGV